MATPDSYGVFGNKQLDTGNSEYNAVCFLVKQILSRVNTSTLVRVKAVYHGAGVSVVGFVDVEPLVNQMDGADQPIPHGVVFQLPYVRIQGGVNAIVIDPEVGDVGLCSFCDHDISSIKASSQLSNPGSKRRFDISDGVYIGGWINKVLPVRYLHISNSGIEIITPDDIKMEAATGEITIPKLVITSSDSITVTSPKIDVSASEQVTITSPVVFVNGQLFVSGILAVLGQGSGVSTFSGSFVMNGSMEVTEDVVAAGISLNSHHHGGVSTGGGNTGGPA